MEEGTIEGTITISLKRYHELEELEKRLPALLDEACTAYKRKRLLELRERDKADLSLVRNRVRKYVETHKEEINERRRQKRKTATDTSLTTNTLIMESSTNSVESSKQNTDTDGPGTEDGEPEERNVGPDGTGPVILEKTGDEKAESPRPKNKGRPKKVVKKGHL